MLRVVRARRGLLARYNSVKQPKRYQPVRLFRPTMSSAALLLQPSLSTMSSMVNSPQQRQHSVCGVGSMSMSRGRITETASLVEPHSCPPISPAHDTTTALATAATAAVHDGSSGVAHQRKVQQFCPHHQDLQTNNNSNNKNHVRAPSGRRHSPPPPHWTSRRTKRKNPPSEFQKNLSNDKNRWRQLWQTVH